MAEDTPAKGDDTPTDDKSAKQDPTKGAEGKTDIDTIASQARDPDAVRNALKQERQAAKDANEALEAAQAQVKAFEDANKSDQEKAADALKTAEARATTAEASSLRLEVAFEKGLPKGLANRLQGDTKRKLEEDADRLLELVKPNGKAAGDPDAGKGEPDEGGSFNALVRAQARR